MLPSLVVENWNEGKEQIGANIQIEPSLTDGAGNDAVNKLDFDDLYQTLID